MSHNAKKRRRGVWIIAVVGLPLFYAFSSGPVVYLANRPDRVTIDGEVIARELIYEAESLSNEHEKWFTIKAFYAPLVKTSEILQVKWLLEDYLQRWGGEIWDIDSETPYRVHGGVI